MNPNELNQTPGLQQIQDLSAIATGATPWVTDCIDVQTAHGRWDVVTDARNRRLIRLSLWDDFHGQSARDFAPNELSVENEAYVRGVLNLMKGALIRVGDWHNRLTQLYQSMQEWVVDLQPQTVLVLTETDITEQLSGTYRVPSAELRRGVEVLRIQPIAIWIVGAQGRVDLIGPNGRTILVFNNNAWFVVVEEIHRQPVPLTAELFRATLQGLFA